MSITADKVKNIILSAKLSFDQSKLDNDTTFSDMGIDSLDSFNIFLALEESLGIKIPDEDVDALTTVNDLVSYLSEHNAKTTA